MKFAIVDLGTNSMRLAIYECQKVGHPQLLYKKKFMLRPGQGVFLTGKLKRPVMRRIEGRLKKFARRLDDERVTHVSAVATSALRDAKNSPQFVRRIQRRTKIKIRVISGLEEARLIARGIVGLEAHLPNNFCLIDIGGGSTEFSFGNRRKVRKSLSLPLGSLRLHQVLITHRKARSISGRLAGILQTRRYVHHILRTHLPAPQGSTRVLAVGSSGTIRALARILSPVRYRFSCRQLRTLIERMLLMSRRELKAIRGMEPRRCDIILSGAILLLEIMEYLQIKSIRTTEFALRDGLVLQASTRAKLNRQK